MPEDQEPYTAEPSLDQIREKGEPDYMELSLAVDPAPFDITAGRANKLIDAMEDGDFRSIDVMSSADWKYIYAVKESTWERKLDYAEQALDDRDTRRHALVLAMGSTSAINTPETIVSNAKLYFDWIASGRTPADKVN